jgi:hypothetical protein
MKKRSAMAIAAGLVAALLAGAAALSLGMTGPQTATASGVREPRVRTIHRTVKVHREAKAEEPQTVTVVTAANSSPAGSSAAGSQGSTFEDGSDDHEDEDHEAEDHEDEDEDESEDHEDEDHEDESGDHEDDD